MNAESITSQPREIIAQLAHQLWELDGRQNGRDLEYWLKAEQQIGAAGRSGSHPSATPTPKARAIMAQAKASAK